MNKRMVAAQLGGLVAGVVADAALGDPRRFHPVAGFGQAASRLERRVYAPTRGAGSRFAAIAVGVPVALAIGAQAATARRPLARAALTAGVTWAVSAAHRCDGKRTRWRLISNASRPPPPSPPPERACRTSSAAIRKRSTPARSPARRSSRSPRTRPTPQVAPLFWGAVAGVPGLVGYRAINTLDAMVGHRSPRYRDFGTASARLDDVANLVPSRLTALLTAATAPMVGADGVAALTTWLRDRDRHPSPNSGQCEAAMAGALGVRLGGRNVYLGRVEERPLLGFGPLPRPTDVRRAARVSAAVGVAALLVCGAGRLVISGRGRASASRRAGFRGGFPMTRRGGLLVAGTTSDAGKSTIVAGICRWLHRQGVRVAPFKAMNMSNNSVVVFDESGAGLAGRGEIGRAQALQAAACGLAPSTRFNPVLLKPGGDMSSQVIVNGQVAFRLEASQFAEARPILADAAFTAYADLRAEFDVVICEGAGSPTEINLREHDFVNMGLANSATFR